MYGDQPYSPEQIVGNAEVPRNSRPTLRGSVRRNEADGSHTAPYITGLSGKTLRIRYTDVDVAEQTANVALTTNAFADAIDAINAAGTTNFGARDAGGYLELFGRRSGGAHFIGVTAYTTYADDAAPLLGFDFYASPYYRNYSGDVASTPGTPTQDNPNGAAFLALDEDLSAAAINRALFSVMARSEYILRAINKEIGLPYVTDALTTRYVAGVGTFALLNTSDIRLPLSIFVASSNPGGSVLSRLFTVLHATLDLIPLKSTASGRYDVDQVVLADLNNFSAVDLTRCFNAGELSSPTTTGRSIYGSDSGTPVTRVLKQGAIAIASIRGNHLYCPGATFITNKVQAGDTAVIEDATNEIPFAHNGEFVIEQVLTEERLTLRRKDSGESAVYADTIFPLGLNRTLGPGEVYGTLKVPVGHWLPAQNIALRIATTDVTGTYATVRLALLRGRNLRDMPIDALTRNIPTGFDSILTQLYAHEQADPAHAATKISASMTSTWAGSSTAGLTGTRAQAVLDGIVSELASTSGAVRLGAAAITGSAGPSGGTSPPYSASGSTIQALVADVLQRINDHAALDVHTGSTTVGPFQAWRDGNPVAPASVDHDDPQTIETWLTDIFLSLYDASASHSGAHKVGCGARSNWADGITNAATSIFFALKAIIDDLGAQAASGRLDGAGKVGMSARGMTAAGVASTLISAGSVAAAFEKLVGTTTTNQLVAVLSKLNVFTNKQTFNGDTGSQFNPSCATTLAPGTGWYKGWWEFVAANIGGTDVYLRTYISETGFTFTYNAKASAYIIPNTSVWNYDKSTVDAWAVELKEGVLRFLTKASGAGSDWTFTPYTDYLFQIDTKTAFGTGTPVVKMLVPGNYAIARAKIDIPHSGAPTVLSGNNIESVALSDADKTLTVTLKSSGSFSDLNEVTPQMCFNTAVDRTDPVWCGALAVGPPTTIRIFSSSTLRPTAPWSNTVNLTVFGKQ